MIAGLALPFAPGPAVAHATAGPSVAEARVDQKIDREVRKDLAEKDTAGFWAVLDSEADLTGVGKLRTKADKAGHVRAAKVRHAARTQASARRLLDRERAEYTSYWIDNSLFVTGDADLARALAALPEVERIEADEPVTVPKPIAGDEEQRVNGVEWNVDRVRAPEVWSQHGVRGEGIVVANIDTGVAFDHPAVAGQYRGRSADGTLDHNYHWFDPAGVCAGAAPCDNNGHGTHTIGTMIGDDGAGNQIGVAPGATWIAAKGCESSSCTRASLLASGQWIVAPTDLSGQNPRPDLAPDVVNNSWGSGTYDPWYAETVRSWIAAGIFPAFSNGNSGPSCNTSGSPGTYQISYSSGAFDINNTIASFSSRGAGENGEIKPNLAAPGVNVRSSVPSGYSSFSGTSMASPHTAAVVALMWSASPAIQGDIDATRQILDDTAVDVDNTTCGGTSDDNNVFGEGRIDALAAVEATPRGALGAAAGRVTSGGAALAGATVTYDGPMLRTTTTDADGGYAFSRLMVGSYSVSVRKFGYLTRTETVAVTEGETAVRDFVVEQAPSATLSGTVRLSSGAAAAGATVEVVGTPVSAQTDASGDYTATLPHGDYTLRVTHANRCADAATAEVSVAGETRQDVTLPLRADSFGYTCGDAPGEYRPGEQLLDLTGDDRLASVTLPFKAALYGKGYRTATVSTNGWLAFNASTSSLPGNRAIPYTGTPNAALYAFWEDLYVDADAGIYTSVTGEAPDRVFSVEWRNVTFYRDRTARVSITAAISETGVVTYRYSGVDNDLESGGSATIGIENGDGTVAFQHSFDEPAVSTGDGIAFRTDAGIGHGAITDANDGEPVAGAEVTATRDGAAVTSDTTDAEGSYVLQAPAGRYQVTVAKEHYETATYDLTISASALTAKSVALRTARVRASVDELAIVTPSGETRSRTVTLTNSGGLGSEYAVSEATGSGTAIDVPWLEVTPVSGELAPGGQQQVRVTVDAAGMADSSFLSARLVVASASGRAPTLTIPVTVVAPGYQAALNTGGRDETVDVHGDSWSSDQAYQEGSRGYVGESHTISTKKAVSGADDPVRYQSLREGMTEYRFDGLADGVYTVELDFAELRAQSPNQRLFDIHIEGSEVVRRLDVANEAGSFAAVGRTFTVRVTDGQLNVQFYPHRGFGLPIVNAIRVTDRPDLTV
ncbi:MAG: S8 family serine peptidase [Micromonosporaceae bacterium]|nr:S8 family serine peptidase [Micromonosporaceae bacterium]